MYDPGHSTTPIEMKPHYSQSSRENATPVQREVPISLLKGSTPSPGEVALWYRRRASVVSSSILVMTKIQSLVWRFYTI